MIACAHKHTHRHACTHTHTHNIYICIYIYILCPCDVRTHTHTHTHTHTTHIHTTRSERRIYGLGSHVVAPVPRNRYSQNSAEGNRKHAMKPVPRNCYSQHSTEGFPYSKRTHFLVRERIPSESTRWNQCPGTATLSILQKVFPIVSEHIL